MARSIGIHRRDWLRYAAISIGAGSMSGWFRALAADATTHPARNKSVILLWLNGGPSTIDLWDLKPGNENGGRFQEIETAVSGIRISEHLPKLAQQTKEMVLIRSMCSKEGDHGRATQFVKTGYLPQGAIHFPAMGAVVAHEIGPKELDLPGFVSIAPQRLAPQLGGGFLGPRYSPLTIGGEANSLDELKVPNLDRAGEVTDASYHERLSLLNGLEKRFAANRSSAVVDGLQAATMRAVRLMQPAAAAAFRLDEEDAKLRDAYGRSIFGQGCLLARRLIERGVSFVEVTLDGWDTHNDNFERVKALSATLDTAFGTLLTDLKDRGLLDSTLVVCQGEFGRTPKINGNQGRDHWPGSWTTALAGGGIRGGQVIGKTSADGMAVEDRPTTVPDLIATVCKAVGIDPKKQNMSNVGRPIRVADPAANPVAEVIG